MELIVIETKQIGNEEINSVDARDLHSRLGVKKDFSNWIKYNIEKLNLIEGTDFSTVAKKGEGGKFAATEYILTLDVSKHIAMMTNTATAHEVRTYFIEFEKKAKSALLTNQQRIPQPAQPVSLLDGFRNILGILEEHDLKIKQGQRIAEHQDMEIKKITSQMPLTLHQLNELKSKCRLVACNATTNPKQQKKIVSQLYIRLKAHQGVSHLVELPMAKNLDMHWYLNSMQPKDARALLN
jgi:phage anti-repressor protein